MEKKNNLFFFLLMLVILMGWMWLGNVIWPPKQKAPPEEPPPVAQAPAEKIPVLPVPLPDEVKPAPREEPVDPDLRQPVVLGSDGGHLTVTLEPRGAGVRKIVANHFQEADALGRPVWADPQSKVKKPLEMVMEDQNSQTASFLLHHFRNPTDEDFPLDTLGRRIWKRIDPVKVVPGQMYQRASFQTSVRGVRITKTYTLEPRWYHLGLEVQLELEDKTKEKEFRYQLTGAHGLPIEGEWYTGTFRNALIGRVDAQGKLGERFLQDLMQITNKGGGDDVVAGNNTLFYAGVAVQYFASVIAVDPRDKADTKFLERARPLLMESAIRGRIIKREGDDLILVDETNKAKTLRFANQEDRKRFEPLLAGQEKVVVVYRTEIDLKGNGRDLITQVLDADQAIPLFHNDITVAVTSRVQKLQPGVPVVNKYVLYNGPVKVMLLDQLKLGAQAVDPALVTFYRDDLHLNTLTDFRSPGVLSDALSWTPWTTIIIFFTNILHWVLYYLSFVMPVHGLCIVLLTIMVRGAMFPISRKQALTSIRMQQLGPELKKLQEKHKGDRQAMAAAQMQLYRQYGVNPFGSCWLILLQMPVFLGLYYALQESIHFRLSSFLWIDNLAAPDMLIPWGSSIPWIARPQDYGWLLYLGPYFNILPVVAVALMIVQQKMTMPPPADDQAAMQMKMMKYMMIFMGLMFYKVAAGLCIYFIASSLWGFAERKLLPKRQREAPAGLAVEPTKPGFFQKLLKARGALPTSKPAASGESTLPMSRPNGSAGSGSVVVPSSLPGRGKKKRPRDRRKIGRPEGSGSGPAGTQSGNGFVPNLRSWWKQTGGKIRDWWKDLLKKAGKK